MSNPVQIFIAYSRIDEQFLDELRRHLMPLTRAGRIQVWYDGEIDAGKVWESEIKKALHAAEIIILLVSSDSIASDYFYGKEVASALERHENGASRVVPLIIRACQWTETPLKNLQAVPKNGFPIANWTPRDNGWFDAVEAIGRIVTDIEQARTAAINAVLEQGKRAKEVETARISAIENQERLEKKRKADNLKNLESEPKKAQKPAYVQISTPKPPKTSTKTDNSKPEPETAEWKINLGVGAVLLVILVISGYLISKTKACLSDFGKNEKPGLVLPVLRDSTVRARPNGSQLVRDAEKIGVPTPKHNNEVKLDSTRVFRPIDRNSIRPKN